MMDKPLILVPIPLTHGKEIYLAFFNLGGKVFKRTGGREELSIGE